MNHKEQRFIFSSQKTVKKDRKTQRTETRVLLRHFTTLHFTVGLSLMPR